MPHHFFSQRLAQAALLLALAASGCAGYAGKVKEMRTALLAGDKAGALRYADESLDVDKPDEMPTKLGSDNALLVLERATIKQGLLEHQTSATDYRAADKHLELLDLKNDTAGNIGKFLFSDNTTVYKAPAYEKLLLNTLNMLNYLALGNLEEARVEARRLAVMQNYLADEGSAQASLVGLGAYLAGFAFEMSGKAEQALQSYSDALAAEHYPSLTQPVQRLAACSSFRSEPLEELLKTYPAAETCTPTGKGTILIVASAGLAPHKEAMRIPIGAAIVIAGAYLGALESQKAQMAAAQGLLAFINFPTLKGASSVYGQLSATVDRQSVPIELGVDVSTKVLAAWESMKAKMMVAAITRLVTRVIAAEATRQGVQSGTDNPLLGMLAGLAVQGSLSAADTPDTRSWVTLPAKVVLGRLEVPAGQHVVQVVFQGSGGRLVMEKQVAVAAGGFAVVPVAAMR